MKSSWFEHLSGRRPAVRLYCFPYAGGSAEVFRGWQTWLREQVDVTLVHLPGRGRTRTQQAFKQLRPLVSAIADRFDCHDQVPYILYGHSMGALLSFELARELIRRHGNGPVRLLVSGARAPQRRAKRKEFTFNLPHEAFVRELKRLDGTPSEVLENAELLDLFIDVLKADFELVETYEYQADARLPCPIVVYTGLDDVHVPADSCEGWKDETSVQCQVRLLEGDHFLIRSPTTEFMSAFTRDVCLARGDGGASFHKSEE